MKKGLIKFIINLSIITIGFWFALLTSILLEMKFFDELFVRQLIVYIVMLLELFVTFRIIYILNRNELWMRTNSK